MATYSNGRVPYTVVSEVLASGTDSNGYWEFRCTPAFAARWAFAKKEAKRRFGRTIFVRAGWNIYRPYDVQVAARQRACAAGNCNGASVAGYSSHGGNWGGRDCLAVDVDPNGLTWDQVDEAMEAAGFSARLITAAMSGFPGGERWHYIDFNAFGPVPAGMGSTQFEEEDMPTAEEIAEAVWKHGIPAQSTDGNYTGKYFDAEGFIAQILARIANPEAIAKSVWKQGIQAQDSSGNGIPGVFWEAQGYLASVASKVGAAAPEVDEGELAKQLAPLLIGSIGRLSDDDVARLATAVADEQAKRMQS